MKRSAIKTRCSGTWTEAKFITFVKNQLRGATRKWPPISQVMKEAWVSRGIYRCNDCKKDVPLTVKGKRNVFVDHIKPIINPAVGFTTWDDFINNLFSEKDNLQVLCGACHTIKTTEERKLAVERRKNKKNELI